ncbi:MAG TPA: hypothetical protein VF787_14550, partial [Thermoanaerobaculia bacterium]
DGKHLRTWKGDEPHEVAAFLLNFFNVIGGGGQVMFRLADVLEEGGFSLEYPSSEDYDLWVRLLRRGRLETLPFVGMIKRTHDGQAWLQYAAVKRANWVGIMRASLEPYLRRPLREDEVDALITVWRHDRKLGMARTADAVMVEAFARFRDAVADRALRACARRKVALQWYVAARHLARRGRPIEAMNYLGRSARWLLTRRASAIA